MTTFTTPTRHTDRTAGLHYAESPVRQRTVLSCGSWRRVTRRIVCGLTCALTVSSLLMPSISFAAEWIEVDNTPYYAGAAAGDGSTWSWNGADDMTLNGYNGGSIAARGKLNVSYEGDNTVANEYGNGISVENGTNESAELNISGTGTLTATAEGNAIYSQDDMTISGTGAVTAKSGSGEGILAGGDMTITGGTVDACSERDCGIVAEETLTVSNSTLTAQGFGSGIHAFDGLTIDAATVRAYAYPAREDSPTAIFTDEGDITIKNGSLVHAYAEGENAAGISSYNNIYPGGSGGRIFISDSTVEAIAHYINRDNGNQPLPPICYSDFVVVEPDATARTFGIIAITENGLTPATISITRSRVTAEGDTAAILAVVNSADGSIAGTINIVDSIIETPNGGRICDVRFFDTDPVDAPYQHGQTIGTASDVITDLYSNAIAKRAVIVPVETPQAKPESKPKVTTAAATIKHVDTKDALAATGDASAMGAVAAAITGVAAIVAGIFTSRKRS